jgi:hypothetical protein
VCRNRAGDLYLVVVEAEQEAFENWLYVQLSPARFAQIRSGEVDLYHAFKDAEDGVVLSVKLYRDRQISAEITAMESHQLLDEQLPEIGETLTAAAASLVLDR